MDYIAVTFRSRGHTVKFYEFLKKKGIYAEMINTPKEAGVGCGLSVKISTEKFALIKRLVHNASLNSFAGFFYVKQVGGKRMVRSI
mgnify:CR=1 FL=1